MHAMANALLEWETIDADQIDDIANGKTPKPPKDSQKSGPKDGGNSSSSGPGSSAKKGDNAPPDGAATATQ
jgi:cell division protease FtsH